MHVGAVLGCRAAAVASVHGVRVFGSCSVLPCVAVAALRLHIASHTARACLGSRVCVRGCDMCRVTRPRSHAHATHVPVALPCRQVGSRLLLVWGYSNQFTHAHWSLYLMAGSWAAVEVPRCVPDCRRPWVAGSLPVAAVLAVSHLPCAYATSATVLVLVQVPVLRGRLGDGPRAWPAVLPPLQPVHGAVPVRHHRCAAPRPSLPWLCALRTWQQDSEKKQEDNVDTV